MSRHIIHHLGINMPYLFGLLVLVNAALLGYLLLVPSTDKNLEQAKARLTAPVEFTNTTQQLPPEIGKK